MNYRVYREDGSFAFERVYDEPAVGEHVHIDSTRVEDVFVQVDHKEGVIKTKNRTHRHQGVLDIHAGKLYHVVKVRQNPLRRRLWYLTLACGHGKWIESKARPLRTTDTCPECSVLGP